jgi:hypothetical protein
MGASFLKYNFSLLAVFVFLGFSANASYGAPGDIPVLNWPQVMSDWINVKTDVSPKPERFS